VIQPASGLSEQEIQQMVRAAEQHAAEDARRREEVDLKNRADNLAYQAEKLINQAADQLPSDLKIELDDQVQAVRRALDQNDVGSLRRAADALEQALRRAESARVPVGAAAAGGGGSSGAADEASSGDSVDAEYREV
jgi:molecular chaperone DnaK